MPKRWWIRPSGSFISSGWLLILIQTRKLGSSMRNGVSAMKKTPNLINLIPIKKQKTPKMPKMPKTHKNSKKEKTLNNSKKLS